MSQTDIILGQLKAGRTVSKLNATHLNIGNIHDVIMRLRRRGNVIVNVSDKDAYGRKFTKYVLVAPGAQKKAA